MNTQFEKLAAAAIKRFKGNNHPGKTVVLFLHHDQFAEILTEPIENRIRFIVEEKNPSEIPTRLKWIQPYIPLPESQAWTDWQKAWTAWQKACADSAKACADSEKAWTDWQKACADSAKACADSAKAWTDWQKAHADSAKACADSEKAWADWQKAHADWQKAQEPLFMAAHPDCPWNGKTLFP